MRRMFSEIQIKRIIKEVIKNEMSDDSAEFYKVVTGDLNVERSGTINDDLHVGNAITGKTIKQSEANWVYSESISVSGYEAGLNYDVGFFRFQEINQKLSLVFVCKVTNETESSKALTYLGFDLLKANIPQSIQEKIFNVNGVSFKDNTALHGYVCSIPSLVGKIDSDNSLDINNIKACVGYIDMGNTKLSIQIKTSQNIPAGQSWVVEGRVTLDLI